MPKPVKKAARKSKAPKKPKRPSDPNRAAHAILAEHMARVQSDPIGASEPADFETLYRQRMAELGKKGGTVSGAKRMENLSERKRKEIAKKAAAARWGKRGSN